MLKDWEDSPTLKTINLNCLQFPCYCQPLSFITVSVQLTNKHYKI